MAVKEDLSSAVRAYAVRNYVQQARRDGKVNFTITAGEVHRALGFHNRVPVVCNALRSDKFLRENGLRLVETHGPPSGLSTTATFTYEFAEIPSATAQRNLDLFLSLRGIARDVYAQSGGGEAYLRAERASWDENPQGEFPGRRPK